MKLRFTHSLMPALLIAAPLAHGQWTAVADLDDYTLGENDPLLAQGWVFQDGDYFAHPPCQDGTNDCTGYREVVASPYNPTEGSSQSILMRAGDPTETFVANSRFNTAIALPQEIPVNGTATLFLHFAIEDAPGARWFGLSDLEFEPTGPIVAPGDPMPLAWGDMGPIFSINQEQEFRVFEANGGGYVPAFEVPGDPDANHAEAEVWYSLWMHIYNDAADEPTDLGGHFELYISGGKFGDEPVHITNTVQVFIDAGITAWTFRRNVGEPIKTFNIVGQYGDPNSTTNGFGGTWINGIYLAVGEITLEKPWSDTPGETETWADWSDDVIDNWIDTGDFLGQIYFDGDWIYAAKSESWFYLPQNYVQPEGAWGYAVRD